MSVQHFPGFDHDVRTASIVVRASPRSEQLTSIGRVLIKVVAAETPGFSRGEESRPAC